MSTSTLRLSSIPYVLWAYKSILLEECFRCSTKPSDYFPENHFIISSSFTTQAAPSVHRIECHRLCLESKAPMLSQHVHRGPSSPSSPTPHPPRHIRWFPSQPSSHLFTSERLSSFSIWPKPSLFFQVLFLGRPFMVGGICKMVVKSMHWVRFPWFDPASTTYWLCDREQVI